MSKEVLLRIAKEEEKRFKALKQSCAACMPDELIEWIEEVICLLRIRHRIIKEQIVWKKGCVNPFLYVKIIKKEKRKK